MSILYKQEEWKTTREAGNPLPLATSITNIRKGWTMDHLFMDANGFGQIEIGFETKGPGLEVTKCGARWAYKQDIENMNQTMRGCNNNKRYQNWVEAMMSMIGMRMEPVEKSWLRNPSESGGFDESV